MPEFAVMTRTIRPLTALEMIGDARAAARRILVNQPNFTFGKERAYVVDARDARAAEKFVKRFADGKGIHLMVHCAIEVSQSWPHPERNELIR